MKSVRNYSNSNRKRLFNSLLVLILVVSGFANVTAQTCTQTGTVTGFVGAGNTAISTSLTPTCQGGGVVTAVSIDGITGAGCGIMWFSRIYVNGNLITNPNTLGCGFIGLSLTSYLPITSVTYEADSYGFTPASATVQLNMTVTYSAGSCTGTPTAGNVVTSTPVICDGDSFDLQLSGQSSSVGLDYQWQTSLDNSAWTNSVNDTLLYITTTLSNTTYYRCVVTCTGSGLSDTSSVDSVLLGFCTPTSDTLCSNNSGPTSVNLSISGWQGMPLSDGILTFNYKGYLTQTTTFLTVTDALGNSYGQLDGSSLFCGDATDELPISLSQLNSLLVAGNGSIDLIISAPSGVNAFCPTSGPDASFCITASLRAATHIFNDDASVSSLITPGSNACVLDSNISVELDNTGLNTLTSAQLNWSLNGVLQSPVSWVGSIPSMDMDTASIGILAGGFTNNDTLVIWSSLPNGSLDSNVVSDTLTSVVHSALNGVYTIAQNGSGDFVNFTDVITTLEAFGVCGPVIFEATDSSYYEQLSVNTSNIGGVSAVNTITFTSQSGNADDVTITYASAGNTDNYVLHINNSQYVTVENLKIRNIGSTHNCVVFAPLSGNNHHITFDHCILESQQTSNSSNSPMYIRGLDNNNWTISNNTILNGYWGIALFDNNDYNDSNLIVGNKLHNQSSDGIYFRRQNEPVVKNNYITSNTLITSSAYAMNLSYFEGAIEISGNHVEGNGQWPRYGMYLGTANGTANSRIKIYNNRFYVPSLASNRGVYLYGVNNADIYYNSIYKNGGPTSNTNSGLMISQSDSNVLLNNVIQLDGEEGFAIYVYGGVTPILNSNNNCISVLDTLSYVGRFNSDSLSTLMDWMTATTFDSNSIVVNQIFSDSLKLNVCSDSLYAKGIDIPGYTEDHEGDTRQNPPCIGADEFIPLADFGYNDSPEICTGDTLVLEQLYYDTVIWYPSMVMSNTLMITSPGSYGVAVSGGCGSDTSMFTVIPQLNAHIGDTNLCEGTAANLSTGISNGTYLWSDGSTDSNLMVNSSQTVSVSVISAWGCNSADSAIITQSFDVVLPDSSTFCEGSSVVLDANMAGTYNWNDGSTGQTLAVTSSGIYTLTVSAQNCISIDTAVVEEILDVLPSFTDSINNMDVIFTNTTLNATSYLWEFGDGATSTLENPTHTYPSSPNPFTYSVKLTGSNSCGDDFVTMDVSNKPDGISELLSEINFNIYPNPSNGEFAIYMDTQSPKNLSVEIVDVRGAVIFQKSYGRVDGKVTKEINLNAQAKGIYIVKITLDGETVVSRVSVR